MRKLLSTTTLMRLALAALIISLLGWIASEHSMIRLRGHDILLTLDKGRITLGLGPVRFWRDDEFRFTTEWRGFRQLHWSGPARFLGTIPGDPPTNVYTFHIPCWLPTLIALANFLIFWWIRPRKLVPPGHCHHCGYDASKCSDGRCSECGQQIVAT